MKVRKRRKRSSVPVMMTELMPASWETIARRTLLMIKNDCSPGEYRRMVKEKPEAAARSASLFALSAGGASLASLLSPWRARAVANARRLRKKQHESARGRSIPERQRASRMFSRFVGLPRLELSTDDGTAGWHPVCWLGSASCKRRKISNVQCCFDGQQQKLLFLVAARLAVVQDGRFEFHRGDGLGRRSGEPRRTAAPFSVDLGPLSNTQWD